MNTDLLNRLIELEHKADLVNGDYGELYSYCYFCGTTEYNGQKGLVHSPTCVITQFRNKINNS